MIENLVSNPMLKNINPTKLRIINEISEQSKHHSLEELLPQIMQINNELNKRNMNFTKEESNLLMKVLEDSLDSEEKAKFNMIKSFL